MEPLTSEFWLNEAALLHDVVWDIVEEAATTAAINAAQGVIQQLLGVGAPAVDFNLLNAAAYEYAQAHTFALVSQITATTQKALQSALTEWIYSGEPLPALIDKLTPMFGPVRAEAIAVTEITRVYAESNIIGWRQYGVDAQRYNTAVDDIVCPICQPHHGNEYSLGYPEATPPLHVRCILPGNEVVIPGILSAATKSFYNGKAIEITVKSGRVLTVTENHPILTPVGYVAAGLLRKGGYAISTLDANGIATAVNPYDDHIPTAIEQVFRSFKESPFVISYSVPATAEDFHGDGRAVDGNIEIVYIDRLLQRDDETALAEQVGEFVFSDDGMTFSPLPPLGHSDLLVMRDSSPTRGPVRRGNLLPPLVIRHERPLDSFGFGLAADRDVGFDETVPDSPAINAQTISDRFFRFARNVSGNNVIGRKFHPVAGSVFVDSGFVHDTSDDLIRHAFLAGQFIERFSGLIAPDEIVSIREFDFTGHVYDLQCDDYELYITEGIITSNCRCWLQPVIKLPGLNNG